MAKRWRRPHVQSPPPRHEANRDALWVVQREVILLAAQLDAEKGALETWVRRLELRLDYEWTHGGTSQLPAIRQATAACHTRVLELGRRLADAKVRLRALRAP